MAASSLSRFLRSRKSSGFTLVELAIVLVIVGLLIAGILVAQSMIQTARVQNTVRNIQQYEIAVNNFWINFKAIPGDTNKFSPPGNNDGFSNFDNLANCAQESERYNSFAHLYQAGMVKDEFVGICSSPISTSYLNTNNAGVVYPLISKTSVDYNGAFEGKSSLITLGCENNPFFCRFSIVLSPSEVVPLFKKIGTIPLNDYSGKGFWDNSTSACIESDGETTTTCTSPTAVWGEIYYILPPLP